METSTIQPIINKVAQKAIVTIDLEELMPKPEAIVSLDIKQYLFKELLLREADFREAVKHTDWSQYAGKYVCVHCSANAIVPMWIYMILSAELTPFAKDIAFAEPANAAEIFLHKNIERLEESSFAGQRLVIKGCGERAVSASAYGLLTQKLSRSARSIMYGEPCSTVPVFKKRVD